MKPEKDWWVMAGFGDRTDVSELPFPNRAPDQTAFVFPDLDEGIEKVSRQLGITDWVGWDYHGDYLPRRFYNGEPSTYRSLAAVPSYGPKLEVIAPIEGPSVFTTFLEDRPNGGLHHLGWFVPDMQDVRHWFALRGITEIMSGGGHGVEGDGEFTYFDTYSLLGAYVEFIQVPARRYAPHFEKHVDLS